MSKSKVGAHQFKPISRWRNKGRCKHCYVPEHLHPIDGWVEARPIGDKRLPKLSGWIDYPHDFYWWDDKTKSN